MKEEDGVSLIAEEGGGAAVEEQSVGLSTTSWTCLALVFAASLNSVLLGYDLGILSPVLFLAKKEFHFSDLKTESIAFFTASAAFAGALVSSLISDGFGRTKTMVVGATLFLGGNLVQHRARTYAAFVLGRALVGFGEGTALMCDPLYVTEIAPKESRGMLVTVSEVAINIGILCRFCAKRQHQP